MGHSDSKTSTSEQVAALWLKSGGRGLDTAWSYHNQDEIGKAVRASNIPRGEIFVTTKIPCCHTTAEAQRYVATNLQQLKMRYVDLTLIHNPRGCTGPQIMATYDALRQARVANQTRAIGVSNFDASQLALLLTQDPPPAVNQCSMSIGNHDDVTIKFCIDHNIRYQAYSPLRHGSFNNPTVQTIATAHNVSTAQVALRWITQRGAALATSSDSATYDLQDLDVLTKFSLSMSEMVQLNGI